MKLKVRSSAAHVLRVSVERGYACRLELGSVDAAGDQGVTEANPVNELRLYLAYYSPSVLGNGWQPYDQPSPAAYMPHAYSDSIRERVPGGGEVVVQLIPKCVGSLSPPRQSKVRTSLRSELEGAFRRAGAPVSAATSAMRAIRRAERELAAGF